MKLEPIPQQKEMICSSFPAPIILCNDTTRSPTQNVAGSDDIIDNTFAASSERRQEHSITAEMSSQSEDATTASLRLPGRFENDQEQLTA